MNEGSKLKIAKMNKSMEYCVYIFHMVNSNKCKVGGIRMIITNQLTKSFIKIKKSGKRTVKESFNAVDHISIEVGKGEIFGILGPNGAGKTTFLRMLGGILTPTEGQVYLDGMNYEEDKNAVKKKIGYLSGNTKLYGRVSPRELLSIFGGLYEMSKLEIEEKTEEIFKLLNMYDFADNRIEHLSTGQTQRTSIARCLIHSPEVYIFDEPTLGLDVLSSSSIIEFMQQEKAKGKTVLYSTHYMEEAETLCDRIAMIHEGKVVAMGTKEELKMQTGTTNLRDAFLQTLKERGELRCE